MLVASGGLDNICSIFSVGGEPGKRVGGKEVVTITSLQYLIYYDFTLFDFNYTVHTP
jgi:hypothetical protein